MAFAGLALVFVLFTSSLTTIHRVLRPYLGGPPTKGWADPAAMHMVLPTTARETRRDAAVAMDLAGGRIAIPLAAKVGDQPG